MSDWQDLQLLFQHSRHSTLGLEQSVVALQKRIPQAKSVLFGFIREERTQGLTHRMSMPFHGKVTTPSSGSRHVLSVTVSRFENQ